MNKYLFMSSIVGGIIGSVLTALLVSPVTAQREKFEEIECTKLTVVDADGVVGLVLSMDDGGGQLYAFGNDGTTGATLGIDKDGGLVVAHGKDGKSASLLSVDEHGGFVSAVGKDGKPALMLSITDDGGIVSTRDRYSNIKVLD